MTFSVICLSLTNCLPVKTENFLRFYEKLTIKSFHVPSSELFIHVFFHSTSQQSSRLSSRRKSTWTKSWSNLIFYRMIPKDFPLSYGKLNPFSASAMGTQRKTFTLFKGSSFEHVEMKSFWLEHERNKLILALIVFSSKDWFRLIDVISLFSSKAGRGSKFLDRWAFSFGETKNFNNILTEDRPVLTNSDVSDHACKIVIAWCVINDIPHF